MQAFELLFGFAVVTWVRNGVSVGVSIENFESHINAHHAASGGVLNLAFGLNTELHIIPIGAAQDANAFDLLERESFNVLLGIAH